MEIKELRIGNLVDVEGAFLPIQAIDSNKEFQELKGTVTIPQFINGKHFTDRGVWISTIKPIPLTEEWLLKFGFEKDVLHDCFVIYQHESIHFALEFFNNQMQLVGHDSADSVEHLKYVHQFQNLYFALTGTELEIKKAESV